MMPTGFKGCNKVLNAPEGVSTDECMNLPVYCDGNSCTSVWELDESELEAIQKSKKIVLSVFMGDTQPPVFLGVLEPNQKK